MPRALARGADGVHQVRISSGRAAVTTTLGLLPCRLALEVRGGPGRASLIAVSARAGVRSIGMRLSGLHLHVARRHLGALEFVPAGIRRGASSSRARAAAPTA